MVNNRKFSRNVQRQNKISQREVEAIEVKQLRLQGYTPMQIGRILGRSKNWVILRLRTEPGNMNNYNQLTPIGSIMPTAETEAENDRLMDILNGEVD